MNFFDRLSNGWTISMNSFKVLKANKQLLIFPVLSGISLVLVIGSFFLTFFITAGDSLDTIDFDNPVLTYTLLFLFYLVNYFIVVFFNMALIHCTRLYFHGEEPTVKKGLAFSVSKIGSIFAWAAFAATVGTILKVIQENTGAIGKFVTGLLGLAWSITTFFVVPVIAYENLGPLDAFKRSSSIIKEKWGESLASSFSFGLVQFICILAIALVGFLTAMLINVFIGAALAVIGVFLVITVMSAAQTVFISAVYHNINGDPVEHFNQQFIDNLFVHKD